MKKFTFLFFMALSMFLCAHADNYLTIGQNDLFRINPSFVGSAYSIPVRAHFDGRLDQWDLTVHQSPELEIISMTKGPGMTIAYRGMHGDTTLIAPFNVEYYCDTTRTIVSHILEYGYWNFNHDNYYEPYGTVKWEAGDYDCMFKIHVLIDPYFTIGHVTISGYVKSGQDDRGGTIANNPEAFYHYITVYLGYKKGDVNGDEHINLTDITILTNYVLNGTGLSNQYELDAADVNGDGLINPTDITVLTNMVVNGVEYVPDDLEEE